MEGYSGWGLNPRGPTTLSTRYKREGIPEPDH